MNVYTRVTDMGLDNTPQLVVSINGAFIDGTGAVQNFNTQLFVTPPNMLTPAALNLKIQQAVVTYVNAQFSLGVVAADIIVLAGVVSV